MIASALTSPSCAIGTVDQTCSSDEFRAKTTFASGSQVCHAEITTPAFLSAVATESVQASKAQLLWFRNIEQSIRGWFHCCNTSKKPYTLSLCIACTSWLQCDPRITLLVKSACKTSSESDEVSCEWLGLPSLHNSCPNFAIDRFALATSLIVMPSLHHVHKIVDPVVILPRDLHVSLPVFPSILQLLEQTFLDPNFSVTIAFFSAFVIPAHCPWRCCTSMKFLWRKCPSCRSLRTTPTAGSTIDKRASNIGHSVVGICNRNCSARIGQSVYLLHLWQDKLHGDDLL